jgi:hypothetical protein
MSVPDQEFHETWLGMVQPTEGLVVSIPVLVEAQCFERQPADAQRKLHACTTQTADGAPTVPQIERLFLDLLGYPHESIETADLERHELYVAEARDSLRPTFALRDPDTKQHLVLVWELPQGLPLDEPEEQTIAWRYPPQAKLDRLLRHARMPIGVLTNGLEVRLVYAPQGEATGSITFRLSDMLSVSGRPIFDAFVMLLGAQRLFGASVERSLPRLLEDSRKWQATVSDRLAEQVFDAATLLLDGFEAASVRDGSTLLAEALESGGEHVHRGILTTLLRIVFLLYAEDSGLMPMRSVAYREGLSVGFLHEQLRADAGAYPDSMGGRFGAWSRLLSVFRAVFLGVEHGDLALPARRGALFDPHRFPFLEGWGPAGGAPVVDADARASLRVPTVSDETVLAVLERLVMLDGQRISYRSLDVEQIGSVYESMLGYTVERLASDAVRLRGGRRWVRVDEALAVPAARRAKWVKDDLGLSGTGATRLAQSLAASKSADEVKTALALVAVKGTDGRPSVRSARSLVLQPKSSIETSTAHYTPRALCRPLVARVLEPVLAGLGPTPTSQQLLSLKVCDPAMGSGAFLVEACRYLGDQVLAAWQREGAPELAMQGEDPLVGARRVVAQRCLYGVDRNVDAVELAKLSLWLVTLAKDLPFTFLDHALRHGDSLVGLDLDQIARFHWAKAESEPVLEKEARLALGEALPIRTQIEALAAVGSPASQDSKRQLLWDAEDAVDRLRTVGDLVLAAYFGGRTRAEREALRVRFREAALPWLRDDAPLPTDVLDALARFRAELRPFHWMVELPEIFDAERADPLDPTRKAVLARMDAFAGNMPFIGGRRIATVHGERYAEWLCESFESTGEVDYVTYFFLRANQLLGTSGTVGFIATSSISQGDTRRMGLQRLMADGLVIYEAQTQLPWPGSANVLVAPVLLAKGTSRALATPLRLNEHEVTTINSRLRSYEEREDPKTLEANARVALVGCFLRGDGFVLSPAEAASIVGSAASEGEVIWPYLVGEDIAKDPHQRASRFVVDFGMRELVDAQAFPQAMRILEERVRPDRERLKSTGADAAHRRYWWRFANPRVELRTQLAKSKTCLVLPRVAKHMLVAQVGTDQVFSEQVVVFATDSMAAFAVLQSRVHEAWVRLLSSTMGEGLRYSATDCFETFPFPRVDPRAAWPALDEVGRQLFDTRAAYMAAEGVGLTTTYNRMKDAEHEEPRIRELRALHEAMDRAVLRAYGEVDLGGEWDGVSVPPFTGGGNEVFEDAVIGRLFALNAARRAAEVVDSEPPTGEPMASNKPKPAAKRR